MVFDIPYIADWNDIGRPRQEQANKDNTRENLTRLPFDYKYCRRKSPHQKR